MQLTEAETEYVVRCIKHTFARHMVFQFDCTNTLNDQLLQKVVVQMEPSEAYEVIHYIPAPSLPYSQPGSCYSLVRLPDDDPTAGPLLLHTHTHRLSSPSSVLTRIVSLQCRARSAAP